MVNWNALFVGVLAGFLVTNVTGSKAVGVVATAIACVVVCEKR